jgi:tetratricopeptide (TPR) repeat protein
MLYGRQKEWQRAIACFERYLRISEEAGFAEGRASAHIELGNLYRLQQDWPRAETLLQQGIDLAQADADYVVLAQGYHYLGNCYARQGNADSIEVLQRALDIVTTYTKQPAQEASIQNTLGETLVRMSRWDEAEAAFQASAGIKERLGDRAGLAMTYGGLGRLYLRQWRFEKAEECFQKDIELLADEPDANVAWIQQQTNSIGEVRRLRGQLDRAEECLRQALTLAERIPDPDVRQQSMGYTHLLWARLELDRANLATAGTEYAAAEQMLAHTWAEGELYRTGARLARARGEQGAARKALDQALALAERGEELDRALVYLEQAYWYHDAGDIEQVRYWAGQAAELAHRLRNAELERRAVEAQDAGQDGP